MVVSKKTDTVKPAQVVTPEDDFMECFHKDNPICVMPKTDTIDTVNIFDVFRPEPRIFLGYTISQTDVKLDAGNTKIHIEQTTANYELPPPDYVFEEPPPPPPPKKKKKIRHSHGKGPVWKFADEIWREKQEALQKIYLLQLEERKKKRKKMDKRTKGKAHNDLMELVGPDWYQELSPTQLAAVDQLRLSMRFDLKNNTAENTQEILGLLGITLKPNRKHVKFALHNCCQSPVEFLLVLYQLINPDRTSYSLNDRLLLSAVVHLTISQTLRELHIRIPSPPRKPPLIELPLKKQRKHYESPYLEPFTFTPETPKHTGIYKNTKKQYPTSFYFDYVYQLKAEIYGYFEEGDGDSCSKSVEYGHIEYETTVTNVGQTSFPASPQQSDSFNKIDLVDQEIIEELYIAQALYDELASNGKAPRLLKPSVRLTCKSIMERFVSKPHEEEEEEKEEEEEEGANQPGNNFSVSVDVTITTELDENSLLVKNICKCTVNYEETPAPDSTPDDFEKKNCKQKNSQQEGFNQKYAKENCQYCPPCALVPRQEDNFANDSEQNGIDENDIISEENRCKITEEDKVVRLKEKESTECACKEEIRQQIDTAFCQCERCKADRSEAEKRCLKYIISGTKIDSAGDPVRIIGGVKQAQKCDCLEKYLTRVKKYEQVKMRYSAQEKLQNSNQKFIITGVSISIDGSPIYQLQGVIPAVPDQSGKLEKERLKEKIRLANMPKIPLGRLKYIISGIQETPNGNVYVITGVVPIDDCGCMKTFKKFKDSHTGCMEAYEEYVQKIEGEINEYMNDIIQEGRWPQDVGECKPNYPLGHFIISGVGETNEGSVYIIKGTIPAGRVNSSKVPETNPPDGIPEIQETRKELTDNDNEDVGSEEPQASSEAFNEDDFEPDYVNVNKDIISISIREDEDSQGSKKSLKEEFFKECVKAFDTDSTEDNKYICICGQKRNKGDKCTCGILIEKEEEEEEPSLLRRFIILEKIPCDVKEQLKIVRKALEILAEDGYALAKLPDAYKLPHFKLWMEFRCRKYWTQEDRREYMKYSKIHWMHTEVCHRNVKLPTLDITKREGDKYTWAQAKRVRKMAGDKVNMYYRAVKQSSIESGREYFPTTFSYEFPTPSFRDCYFAYTPAKEDDCFAYRVWQPFEIKNLQDRQSCL